MATREGLNWRNGPIHYDSAGTYTYEPKTNRNRQIKPLEEDRTVTSSTIQTSSIAIYIDPITDSLSIGMYICSATYLFKKITFYLFFRSNSFAVSADSNDDPKFTP